MGCREFFEANATNQDSCKALQNESLETQIEWESQTASEHSPGPVVDDEQLVRYWLNPVHFDRQTGTLKPTAFDEACSFGLSVNRLKHVTIDEVRDLAQCRVNQSGQANPDQVPRELIGYSAFSAAEVRKVQTADPPPGRRAFGVYDTANPQDLSHADVCQIASKAQGAKSARMQMRQLANSRLKSF